jgi:hypothetical protein
VSSARATTHAATSGRASDLGHDLVACYRRAAHGSRWALPEILPEVVMTRDNGKKAVNYSKIIPLLIESIKELKTELDDLKSSKT